MSARKMRYCQYSKCGKLITRPIGGKDSGKYCDRTCYFAAIDAGEQRFQGSLRGLDWQLAVWFEDWESQRPRYLNCEYCGVATNNTRFCGTKCARKAWYWDGKPKQCVDCGASIDGLMHQRRGRCKACRGKRLKLAVRAYRRKHRHLFGGHRRRCRHYGVPYDKSVTRRAVFERDRYVCQICGVQCLHRFTWKGAKPHVLSPTVDHIMPLSWRDRGHTWDNVQCACWACNTRKSDTRGGQLRLALK